MSLPMCSGEDEVASTAKHTISQATSKNFCKLCIDVSSSFGVGGCRLVPRSVVMQAQLVVERQESMLMFSLDFSNLQVRVLHQRAARQVRDPCRDIIRGEDTKGQVRWF